ncbi:cytochrome d ubiquinol oxidase subunit II [Paenibacillus sp. 481]|uniref:cytochrome d ubiquinol oxidase subunit II n=1 Tax=Paenibacillus sp. 481 TaxID=2835869 RepID=UPI001E355F95|nr:cytochrome d ubiquinol oxidase subunit II [Paenibacillus sp. 481]UHA74812.1 cytochrome d ubiquinol oxidase subunit II [Paenibacillus sp. 481]
MSDATIAISVIWLFLFIYSLLGSVDFGAGFWAMVYAGKGMEDNTRASVLANRYLSPSWKITNTFLVLLVVALFGFFPGATYPLASLLLLPVCLVLVLLTIRSTFMVYGYHAKKFQRALRIISGITGLLIPCLLVTVLIVTLGGFITEAPDGTLSLNYGKLLVSPTLYAHLAFGLATELFFSALFLADYAHEARDRSTYIVYRRLAVIFGPISMISALLVTFTMLPEARWIVEQFRQQLPLFGLSALTFIVGYVFLFIKRKDGWVGYTRVTVTLIAIQYALASIAYGRAHLPYIIYPYLTLEEGVTNPTVLRSLLIGYTVSTLLLIPVFIIFWKLFLKDKRYLKQE